MYPELKERAASCREDLAAFAQVLVRTQSFSFREEAVAGIVQDLLEDLAYDLVFRDEVGNVVGFLAGSEEGPTVLLNSHMDTRRPDDELFGPEGPFSGRVEQGLLRGLGAAACKGGLAAQVFAGHILDKSLLPLRGTIVFAATVAQEEGNGAGVRYLMEQTLPKLGVNPDLAILGEPTALFPCNGHDGWADVDVAIAARDTGSARRAAAAIHDALSGVASGESRKDGVLSARVAGPAHGEKIESPETSLRVLCRVGSGEEVADSVGLVKRLALSAVDPIGDVSIEVRVHGERRRFYTGKTAEVLCWSNPWLTDPSGPLVSRSLEALSASGWRDPTARTWGLDTFRMGTAGSLLAGSYHVPTLCFGPGDEGRARGEEESVALESLVDAVFGTAVLTHGAIGSPLPMRWPTDRAPSDPGNVSPTRSGK